MISLRATLRRLTAIALCSVVMSAAAAELPSRATAGGEPLQNLSLTACHNCFESRYDTSVAGILSYTTVLEFDFWDDVIAPHSRAKPGAWYVRHNLWKGNRNVCGSLPGQRRKDLEGCLLDVAAWSTNNPDHPLIVLFLDKKQGWGATRMPQDFDAMLRRVFGKKLLEPREMRGERSSLREQIETEGWPASDRLSRRVLVALTGGSITALPPNRTLGQYLDRDEAAAAFVAPEIKSEAEIDNTPGIRPHLLDDVVILNFGVSKAEIARTAHERKLLTRVFGDDPATEDAAYLQRLVDLSVNFIALFDYRQAFRR